MDSSYTWVYLAFLCAFGQALGWAYKKKSLNVQSLNLDGNINCTLGAVAYITAGVVLLFLWNVTNNTESIVIGENFYEALCIIVGLNILAAWTGFQAVDKGELSKLMPYIALTALFMVPIEYVLRDVLPNVMQIIGMGIVITGAVLFADKQPTASSVKALKYFLVTLVCYSISSVYMAVLVDETGNGLFSAMVMHVCIGVGFIPLLFFAREHIQIKKIIRDGNALRVIKPMVIAGCIIALLENGPAYTALESASAAEVFAIKRTMPFFALLLGVIMFREKLVTRHYVGTFLFVVGSVGVVFFKT